MQSIVDTLSAVAGWAEAHPVLFTAIIWPFVLGFFTLLFKPRTPAEYAAIAEHSPRLAGFLQLMGALGIDPVKATTIVTEKIVKGGSKPPPPPAGPSVLTPRGEIPPPKSGVMRIGLLVVAIVVLLMSVSLRGDRVRDSIERSAAPVAAAQGCAWLEQSKGPLVDILADKTRCALQNMNLPNDELVRRCLLTPEDIPRILPLLGVAREEAAREALGARLDERAMRSTCEDAGAGDASGD